MAKKSNKPTSNLDMFYVFREDDNYYIHAEYLEERTDGLHKITIHKVRLPLFKERPNMSIEHSLDSRLISQIAYADFGFGDLVCDPDHTIAPTN